MVDFAGWSMPVMYSSIVSEHQACRTAAAAFDVSHMGRLRFDGPGAASFLDRILTRRVANLAVGKIRYSLVCNEEGGILDDVLVYHLEKPSGTRYHLLVVNASNRAKIVDWLGKQLQPDDQVEISDRTVDTAMIAVQGPRALELVQPLFDTDPATLGYYTGVVTRSRGRVCIVSRTGYTGEDGCELIVRAEDASDIWNNVMRAGRDLGIMAAGLGARDTLRLEAAMPLYGHELSESIHPFQAGLQFAVHLKDRQFVGRDALQALRDQSAPCRVGLQLDGRRAAREDYTVWMQDRQVGTVTSGTFSPTLQRPIAMAYVDASVATLGTQLEVDIRGRRAAAEVVALPFYKRPTRST